MLGGAHALEGNFEDRATATTGTVGAKLAARGYPVEVPVAALHQPFGVGAVLEVEDVQSAQGSSGRDSEQSATAIGSSKASCPVKVSIGALHQRTVRVATVGAVVEAVKRGQPATWVIFNTVPALLAPP